ncbi:hypothetical protein [Methylobacterium nonmethylotrophicum]|uniref:Uncharacterized protein n=1 Tax=Methylobacterium nonmethylotrophicum TaxID=1141884 RepID=A0A4Z0NRT4_9HYPH|nr:hypothetical protein [Methylobacterium nonmethylotrophicum]TGD99871.1 hypothetical protein EU555_12005 [Methylobacterium nonmethylotrophicum]
MPVSSKTFSNLALRLEDQVEHEHFFLKIYPHYAEPVRQAIADWMASLTEDATNEDFDKLFTYLNRYGNYRAKTNQNPFFLDRPAADSEPQDGYSRGPGMAGS